MSSRKAFRVLLDTSFVLPSLGVETGKEVRRGLERLAKFGAEIFYSRFSILESLWVIVRTIQDAKFDLETINIGLRSIMEGTRYRRVEESSHIFGEALRLYRLGHKDMIDNILYATSAEQGLRFLTVDKSLGTFLSDEELENTLMSP